jgi:hypothetical protein
MPNARRTRAIAIAKTDDRANQLRFRLMIAAGATAALLAVLFVL